MGARKKEKRNEIPRDPVAPAGVRAVERENIGVGVEIVLTEV